MQSKPLGYDDISGFDFVKEMLDGEPTYAINFDRVQWDSKFEQYIIIEFLLCEESQTVTPHTSHPNRYFKKNKKKFISLWEISLELNARLYLVNYAKKGSKNEDEVLFMIVQNVDENNLYNPVSTENYPMTRQEFAKRFREINRRGNK